MSNHLSNTMLDEALGLAGGERGISGEVLLVEDCVETSGAFVLYHIMKRALSPGSLEVLIFVALAHPFSHYDRILRKMGCNLTAQKDQKRFLFVDMLLLESPDQVGFSGFFSKVQDAMDVISSARGNNSNSITLIIDDLSILEIAAHGSKDHVLDLLHYFITLTSEHGCSLVVLTHEDIYSCMESPGLLLQLEYLADIVVKTEPLTTGLAADVHGQVTVVNRGNFGQAHLRSKLHNFHFKLKENGAEFFYPGSPS